MYLVKGIQYLYIQRVYNTKNTKIKRMLSYFYVLKISRDCAVILTVMIQPFVCIGRMSFFELEKGHLLTSGVPNT